MRYSKKDMKIRVDYNNMMQSVLGKNGVSDKTLNAMADEAKKAFEAVEAGKGKGTDSPQ